MARSVWCLALALMAQGAAAEEAAPYPDLASWGEALFFDVTLSQNRTQACATCHDPATGFADPRETVLGHAVSLGDDGASLGDRNAPTASYARFSPPFGRDAKGAWVGGQFLDGRAATLADQAKGPPLNPLEMGLPDVATAAARLRENPQYVATLAALFPQAPTSDDAFFDAMAQAIAAYEATLEFAPFDSKYDRFLRGEAKLTDQEELGRVLFFSNQFTNCNQCHQLKPQGGAEGETFTNYAYHNIGVPENTAVRAGNGTAPGTVDAGLAANPAVAGAATERGKFKVPTLRNVAVTGPYMHNGVFADLRTVILFYNTYNTTVPARKINPETGQPFAAPEVPENLSLTELESGPALDDQRIDALVAFLNTLTDARYEPLLQPAP